MGNYVSTAIEKIQGIKTIEGGGNPVMGKKSTLHPNKLDSCILLASQMFSLS